MNTRTHLKANDEQFLDIILMLQQYSLPKIQTAIITYTKKIYISKEWGLHLRNMILQGVQDSMTNYLSV